MKLLLLLLILAPGSPTTGEVTAKFLDGRTATGRLERWHDAQIVLHTDGASQTIAIDELLEVRWPTNDAVDPSSRSIGVELVDGTKIPCTVYTVEDRVATVESPLAAEPLKVRVELIRRVELMPSSDALDAAWQETQRREIGGDLLLVSKQDGAVIDYLSGVIGDVTPELASFQWDGERLQVKRSKIAGIAYYHAKAPSLPESICDLTTIGGSEIPAASLELSDEAAIATTPAGVQLRIPLSNLARADFSRGKLAYLSDLSPVRSHWTPRIAPPEGSKFIGVQGEPRRNESFSGSPLSLQWKDDPLPSRRDIRTYSNGLAIRSRTELQYRVPEKMNRFTAIAGIDPTTTSQGHVTLEIRADDRVVWEGQIDGKMPPVEIDVHIDSPRRLQLLVDYGDNLDYGDRLHLIEARLSK